MNGIDAAYAGSYLNSVIASSFANPYSAQAANNARVSDANLRADAQRAAAQYGAGANVSIKYQYATGPDGQLYATDATISASSRARQGEQLLPPHQRTSPAAQPFTLQDARPKKFADLLAPRASLSPAAEAAIFGSEEFLNALESDDSRYRARLQQADFGVRAQEKQHFFASGGLGQILEYDLEMGPDGELYAVAGRVDIRGGSASSEEEAARDAATIARAALAATDVSAQDVSVARDALSKAASLYARNNDIALREFGGYDEAA